MEIEKKTVYNILPSEMVEIEKHKLFRSENQKSELSIEDAIKEWVAKYEADYLKWKTKMDNLEQKEEIDKHKYIRSQQEGRDLGPEAVDEWREKYAPIWRQEKESLVNNGFLEKKVTIQNILGLHVRPSSTVVKIALKYDCELYVHKQGMENYNFTIHKKPYMNVRSVIATSKLLELCAAKGDELEFISYGRQAKDVLDEIEDIVNKKFLEEE
jgi:phosphotransferase system HPr (HPr) family protein